MSLSSSELEDLADYLLRDEFQDRRRNKMQSADCPVLSPSQMKRRFLMEIPYSNLSEKQRIDCRSKNLDYYSRDGE
jgi:hypothetical protein